MNANTTRANSAQNPTKNAIFSNQTLNQSNPIALQRALNLSRSELIAVSFERPQADSVEGYRALIKAGAKLTEAQEIFMVMALLADLKGFEKKYQAAVQSNAIGSRAPVTEYGYVGGAA